MTLNLTIVAGGTPPYNFTTVPGDGSRLYGPNVSHTWVRPGVYLVAIWAVDSSVPCHATGTSVEIDAWGPGGANPAHFTQSTTSGSAPLSVNYTVNITGLPPNATINWTCVDGNGNGVWTAPPGSSASCTYYLHGPVFPEVFVWYPDGGEFWNGMGPWANVTGPSLVSANVTPARGTSPLNVTVWANTTNASLLPGSYHLWVGLVPFVSATCARPPVPASTVPANFAAPVQFGPLLYDRSCANGGWGGGPPFNALENYGVNAWVTDGRNRTILEVGLTVVVVPSVSEQPFPAISLVIAPANGTAPLNVTFQVSAAGATPPYSLGLGIVGAGPASPNGSRAPLYFYDLTGWAGGALTTTHTFPAGAYMIVATVADLWNNQSWGVGYVSAVRSTAVPPLIASAQVQRVGAPSSGAFKFEVKVTGGYPPYSIQWAYGDGTFGSSLDSAPVSHAYATAGSYSVGLAVRDSSGQLVLRTLSVAIAAPATSSGLLVTAQASWPVAVAGLAVIGAAALVGAGLRGRRRRLAADGSALVQAMRADSAQLSDRPPPGR